MGLSKRLRQNDRTIERGRRSMTDYLNDKQIDSELIIGLVTAVRSQTSLVIDLLKERLGCGWLQSAHP